MFNDTLSCCIQKYVGENSKSIENLTMLFTLVKPCFAPKENFSQVLFYLVSYHDEIPDCYKRQTIHKDCESSTSRTGALTSFWVIVMLVAALGNLMVCIVIRKTRSLRVVITNHFIASLAVSDLMVAVFLVPVKIYLALKSKSWCSSRTMCRYYMTMDNISFVASITNLLVITADRFIAITWPYRYQEVVTNKSSKFVIVVVWVYALAIGAFTNINWEGSSSTTANGNACWVHNKIYITFVFIAVFYIPSVVMGFAQGKMMLIALRQSKMIASTLKIGESFREASEDEDSAVMQPKHITMRIKRRLAEYKPVKAVMMVYGTFVVCWMPVSIISLMHAWCAHCVVFKPWHIAVFVDVLPILNSTFNFFIYSVMNRQFRKACKRFFHQIGLIRRLNSHLN